MAYYFQYGNLGVEAFIQAQRLCSALGYNGLHIVPSRGERSYLLNDLERFLSSHLVSSFQYQPSSVALLYLMSGAGHRLWPTAGDGLLIFPNDGNM